jgi:DeoR/GlpR family transcriptional regulator of sugar metabolism
MPSTKIFIAYSHLESNESWVESFSNALKKEGLSVWLDKNEIRPGDNIATAIEEGIRNSDMIVAILDRSNLNRPNTSFEIGAAIAMGKDVVAIVPSDMSITELPSPLRSRRCLAMLSPEETAMLLSKRHYGVTPSYEMRLSRSPYAKQAIAHFIVSEYLKDMDCILLDAGTTCTYVARELCGQFSSTKHAASYTVMTNNMLAFYELVTRSDKVTTILTGGVYDNSLGALVGSKVEESLKKFFPTTVIISASGVSVKEGLFCHGLTSELPIKRLFCRIPCRNRIIAVDRAKLGYIDTILVADWKELGKDTEHCILVTNSEAPSVKTREIAKSRDMLHMLQSDFGVIVHEVKINKALIRGSSKNYASPNEASCDL